MIMEPDFQMGFDEALIAGRTCREISVQESSTVASVRPAYGSNKDNPLYSGSVTAPLNKAA